jgi:hypothetical protein
VVPTSRAPARSSPLLGVCSSLLRGLVLLHAQGLAGQAARRIFSTCVMASPIVSAFSSVTKSRSPEILARDARGNSRIPEHAVGPKPAEQILPGRRSRPAPRSTEGRMGDTLRARIWSRAVLIVSSRGKQSSRRPLHAAAPAAVLRSDGNLAEEGNLCSDALAEDEGARAHYCQYRRRICIWDRPCMCDDGYGLYPTSCR